MEFKKYRIIQDRIYVSDFDELLLNSKKLNKKTEGKNYAGKSKNK